ncbi:MAG: hypothetical protein HQL38_06690 [Alphaproteobacteria bacterium]|nr:hypothetical protein [Alphaproteobacteria bacterium]
MNAKTWTVAEAKAKVGELIEQAQAVEPPTIRRKGDLAEFLAASPLGEADLVIERDQSGPREVDL